MVLYVYKHSKYLRYCFFSQWKTYNIYIFETSEQTLERNEKKKYCAMFLLTYKDWSQAVILVLYLILHYKNIAFHKQHIPVFNKDSAYLNRNIS